MFKYLIFIFIVFLNLEFKAQTFDLVVLNNGDSIACKIDSVTTEKVYFKMMLEYKWVSIDKMNNEVVDYRKDAIKNSSVFFKEGTSYIDKLVKVSPINSVKDIYRNSVYAEIAGNGSLISLNYERLIPFTEHSAMAARFGYGIGYNLVIVESTYLYGKAKHFFETGIACSTNFNNSLVSLRAGYRYVGSKGFLFRAAPLLDYNKFSGRSNLWGIWFGISVGYSF